jgi:hypothetical protein
MLSIRIRRVVSIFSLTAATSILPATGLHASPRNEPRNERRAEHRVVSQSFSFWKLLVGLWEQAGLRIDDNG